MEEKYAGELLPRTTHLSSARPRPRAKGLETDRPVQEMPLIRVAPYLHQEPFPPASQSCTVHFFHFMPFCVLCFWPLQKNDLHQKNPIGVKHRLATTHQDGPMTSRGKLRCVHCLVSVESWLTAEAEENRQCVDGLPFSPARLCSADQAQSNNRGDTFDVEKFFLSFTQLNFLYSTLCMCVLV